MSKEPVNGDGPCYCCRCNCWWSLVGNDHWICGLCHPPAPGAVKAGIMWKGVEPVKKEKVA
jgi:hypothetical protein